MADEPTALFDLVDDGPVPVGEIVHQPIEVELEGGLSQHIVVTASAKEVLDAYLHDTVVAFEAVESAAPSPDDVDVAELIDEHLMTGAGEAGEFVVVRFMPSPGVGALQLRVAATKGLEAGISRYYVPAAKCTINVNFTCTDGEIKCVITPCDKTKTTIPYADTAGKMPMWSETRKKGSGKKTYTNETSAFWLMRLLGVAKVSQYDLSGTYQYSDYKPKD